MQHEQENYKTLLRCLVLAGAFVVLSQPGYSAGITKPGVPDSILTGGPEGPCDPQTASADYVGGTDVRGNPVAPADLEGPAVPVPGHIEIPLKSGAYVEADGKSLAPLLNPPPGCAPPAKSAR